MSFSCPQANIIEFIQIAKRYGFSGIEPRINSGHAHGIEPEAAASSLQIPKAFSVVQQAP